MLRLTYLNSTRHHHKVSQSQSTLLVLATRSLTTTTARNSAAMNNSDNEVIYDAIVCGLGGVGSFALRSLSKKNTKSRVLGIERFQINHDLGSSHGDTRIFRHAYFEHPNYVPLCLKSSKMFDELCAWKKQKKEGENSSSSCVHIPLLERCGVLIVSDSEKDIDTSGRCATDNDDDIVQLSYNSAKKYDIPVEILNTTELRKRYGNNGNVPFQIEDNMKGILEPDAGFVRPELAIQYAIEDALDNGAEILQDTQVLSISQENQHSESETLYTIKTSNNSNGSTTSSSYKTRAVLISAGPWTSKLLPEWSPYLKCTRQILTWFNPNPDHVPKFHPSSFPAWFLDRKEDPLAIYGVPFDPLNSSKDDHDHKQQQHLVKVSLHKRNDVMDPDEECPLHVSKEETNEVEKVLKTWIPSFFSSSSSSTSKESTSPSRLVKSKSCVYTMSPDENFIFDRVRVENDENKEKSNVWCIAGLSGHGFKMVPALGQAAADLLSDGSTDLPIDFLKVDRLSQETSSNNNNK